MSNIFKNKRRMIIYSLIIHMMVLLSCTKNGNDGTPLPPDTTPLTNEVEVWLTSGNQASRLQKQTSILAFSQSPNNYPTIAVDSSVLFQSVDGFGYTLTGGSAMLLNKMSSSSRENILQELFGCTGEQACISYLRLSIGASDLDDRVFSYSDLPDGKEDMTLSSFSLSRDTLHLLPVIKQILNIQPNIKFMATPWSPPVWMKSNGSSIGGNLLPKYYDVYADYLVKYLQSMKTHGIDIDAITVQNEPQHGGNNPSLVMSAGEQAQFVKKHLGPKLKAAGLKTKIIIWDHNCDRPDYPISILNDSEAKSFIDGSAFHLYAGDISALSQVHQAHPTKNLYFTEQWTGANGSFDGDLQWHVKNVIIGSMRNWSKVALEWNLASDPLFDPHTPGGCTQCKGALIIDGNIVTKNVGYYIIAHASRFVPAGSVRIESNTINNVHQVVFLTPKGKKVMIALNETDKSEIFNIQYKGKKALASLAAGTVGTFVW
jgi:glucosylceramidase